MIIYGVSGGDVYRVVGNVSRTEYAGNLQCRYIQDMSTAKRDAARFTLRVADSYGVGARSSASQSGRGPQGGRAMPVACWHAHYDVLDALTILAVERGISPRIRSALYSSDSRESWLRNARMSAQLNIGSLFVPATAIECCDCFHGSRYRGDDPDPSILRRDALFPGSRPGVTPERSPLPESSSSADSMSPDTREPYPFTLPELSSKAPALEDTLERIDALTREEVSSS